MESRVVFFEDSVFEEADPGDCVVARGEMYRELFFLNLVWR